ncbi:MAG: HAMP domain-containing sensor histidine kinase [Candidatus Margulisiibacteriota bacterium]
MIIPKTFKYFFNLGITKQLNQTLIKQVKLTNQITVFMFISALPYSLIFYKFNLHMAAKMVLATLFLYMIIFSLNALSKYESASFLVIATQALIILPFFSIYLGYQSGAHLMYIPLSILPLILYPSELKKGMRKLGYSVIVLSIISVTLINFLVPKLTTLIPSNSLKFIYMFAFFTTFGLILPQVNAFNRSEQEAAKKLERSNKKLSSALTQLRESKESERQLRQYADYARLVQRIAHEFKNPLQMLQGSAELGMHNKSNHKKLFKVVLESVDRLNHLIQPMLNYLSSKQNYKFIAFNISEIVNDILLLSKANCKARQIKMNVINQLKNPVVHGDPNAIGQVIINLVSNAIDAINHNDGSVLIKLENDQFIHEGNMIDGIKINITDNGCGIKQDSLKKIFVPYETSKADKNNVGLGLSIVSKIIEDHSGLIKINSVEKKYTTVSIWLSSSIANVSKPKEEPVFELDFDFFETDNSLQLTDKVTSSSLT